MKRITTLEAKTQILAHEEVTSSKEARNEFREELYKKYVIIDDDGDEVTRGCVMCDSFTNCSLIGTEEN